MRAAIALFVGVLAGCGGGSAAPASPSQPTAPSQPPAPPAPTSWSITGRILDAPAGSPIEGASLVFGDPPAVTTDAAGSYTIVTTDGSTKPLAISAPGHLTRETSLTGGEPRSRVDFDLIGGEPQFPREQYLHLTRNAFEGPNKHEPTRHWTANPNVYIVTRWRGLNGEITDAEISPESLAFLVSEIRRLVPQWTGGMLQAGIIESGPTRRPSTKGWINVEYGRSGNWSRLGEDPGQVQLGSEGTCQSLAIFHEFGHALGYWHSSVRPSIMGGGPGRCELYDLTPNEALIARVMYSRAPGNVEPDKDGPPPPPSPVYTLLPTPPGRSSPPAIHCDGLLHR
jgi:hypothetical protein